MPCVLHEPAKLVQHLDIAEKTIESAQPSAFNWWLTHNHSLDLYPLCALFKEFIILTSHCGSNDSEQV